MSFVKRLLVVLCAGAVLAIVGSGCNLRLGVASAGPAPHPELVAAATARLQAESQGFLAGNPDRAAQFSTGSAAASDRVVARSLAAQQAAGDTTDYGFDVLSVIAYPVVSQTGAPQDFIAYEKTKSHASGGIGQSVEVYHEDTPAGPWKAAMSASLADNVDPPTPALGGNGTAAFLTPAELSAAQANPEGVAAHYADAMNSGESATRLPPGTFAPGVFTTGAVSGAVSFLSSSSDHGNGALQWTGAPGGVGIRLAHGVLVFAYATEIERLRRDTNVNGKSYFVVQDPKRLNYGGLLAPGEYSSLDMSWDLTLAVVVPEHPTAGLPDVVGRGTTQTSLSGVLSDDNPTTT